jgi:hypothetical protein
MFVWFDGLVAVPGVCMHSLFAHMHVCVCASAYAYVCLYVCVCVVDWTCAIHRDAKTRTKNDTQTDKADDFDHAPAHLSRESFVHREREREENKRTKSHINRSDKADITMERIYP